VFGLLAGLMIGLTFGLMLTLDVRPEVINSPRRLVRRGLTQAAGRLACGIGSA